MIKFGRNYRLTIQMSDDANEAIVVQPPLTLQFSLTRSIMASLNTGDFYIYNLSKETRHKIFQDRFNGALSVNRKITLEAGYGNQLTTVFIGNIFEANSARKGVDIVTHINARDGGYAVPITNTFTTVQKGTTMDALVKGLIGQFSPYLTQGSIGQINGTLQRPATLEGNTWDLLKTYTNNAAYVDLEQVHVLNGNEVIPGDIPLIDAATGLLDTPKRDDSYLTITTLFEPRILMGQALALQSITLPEYDGQYKVIGVNHAGIISEAVAGKCTSTFNLLVGSQIFGNTKTVSN